MPNPPANQSSARFGSTEAAHTRPLLPLTPRHPARWSVTGDDRNDLTLFLPRSRGLGLAKRVGFVPNRVISVTSSPRFTGRHSAAAAGRAWCCAACCDRVGARAGLFGRGSVRKKPATLSKREIVRAGSQARSYRESAQTATPEDMNGGDIPTNRKPRSASIAWSSGKSRSPS
jgi:hypothetical protein